MTWIAKYKAVSEEALIDNTLALVVRDFKSALDDLYPSESLDDFAERSMGMVLGLEAPALGIGPRRNASVSSDDDSHLKEILGMDLAVIVIDDNPILVTRKIMRYMRTLEQVLRRGSKNDFFGTVDGGELTFGFSLDCEHVYEQDILVNASTYLRKATLRVLVNINEGSAAR